MAGNCSQFDGKLAECVATAVWYIKVVEPRFCAYASPNCVPVSCLLWVPGSKLFSTDAAVVCNLRVFYFGTMMMAVAFHWAALVFALIQTPNWSGVRWVVGMYVSAAWPVCFLFAFAHQLNRDQGVLLMTCVGLVPGMIVYVLPATPREARSVFSTLVSCCWILLLAASDAGEYLLFAPTVVLFVLIALFLDLLRVLLRSPTAAGAAASIILTSGSDCVIFGLALLCVIQPPQTWALSLGSILMGVMIRFWFTHFDPSCRLNLKHTRNAVGTLSVLGWSLMGGPSLVQQRNFALVSVGSLILWLSAVALLCTGIRHRGPACPAACQQICMRNAFGEHMPDALVNLTSEF